jgi:hypothetical protein
MPSGQFPAISAGQLLTAALLLSMIPQTAWKSADLPRNTTTTVTADPDLQFAVAANGTYIFAAFLFASGPALGTADIKVAFTAPTGAAFAWSGIGISTSSTSPNIVAVRTTSGSSNPFGINGSETPAILFGAVINGATPGSFALEWAQNTSNGTPTILKAPSCLFALRTA